MCIYMNYDAILTNVLHFTLNCAHVRFFFYYEHLCSGISYRI